jgi:hypothetical protein
MLHKHHLLAPTKSEQKPQDPKIVQEVLKAQLGHEGVVTYFVMQFVISIRDEEAKHIIFTDSAAHLCVAIQRWWQWPL